MQQVVCAAFDPESTGSPGYPLIDIPVGVHGPHPPRLARPSIAPESWHVGGTRCLVVRVGK